MKLTVLILAVLLPLASCVFVPDHRGDGPRDDREHRDHCDHDGNCDHP